MNFYQSMKGQSTIATSEGEESNLASQFGDLSIGDPTNNKFNNPGANVQIERPIKSSGAYDVDADDGQQSQIFEDNLAELNQIQSEEDN